jgi:tetratricopeptide (TPR) repeat protein
MAYLKLKEFKNALNDANSALKIKPDYLKAFHRRGKAYQALHRYEEAIRDYQLILEQEPHNEGVNKDLKDAR